MVNYFRLVWDRMFPPAPQDELKEIAKLRRIAVERREEHALNLDQAGLAGREKGSPLLTQSRKRMLDAESAHMVALQRWENREARQRSA